MQSSILHFWILLDVVLFLKNMEIRSQMSVSQWLEEAACSHWVDHCFFAVRKLEQHVRRILWDILLDLRPNDIGRTLRDLAAHVISFQEGGPIMDKTTGTSGEYICLGLGWAGSEPWFRWRISVTNFDDEFRWRVSVMVFEDGFLLMHCCDEYYFEKILMRCCAALFTTVLCIEFSKSKGVWYPMFLYASS